jgi:phosphohistidine phosphatase SixA
VKTIELRRHAQRQPDEDRLSPAGRELATRVGSTIGEPFDLVFVSPASRASETAALLAPDRTTTVVDGLGSDAEPGELANVVRNLFGELTDGSRALAVGHTPLIEKAVLGLTGREIASLGECEGVRVVDEEGRYVIEEVRL